MAKADLTAQRLRELLHYDPVTGVFTRETARGRKIVGTPHNKGYRVLRVNGTLYLAHRIAWLYMTGQWPEAQIDHINGVRDCNKWLNLRQATPAQNQQNRGVDRNNKSGHPGVSWYEPGKKWRARITASGREISIGYFDSVVDASKARAKAKMRLHEFCPIVRY
jgi:hypothetical protein